MSRYHKNCKKDASEKSEPKQLSLDSTLDSLPPSKPKTPQKSSVLDILNSERDCNCGAVVRAMRSNLHTNLGLTTKRDNINKSDTDTAGPVNKPSK